MTLKYLLPVLYVENNGGQSLILHDYARQFAVVSFITVIIKQMIKDAKDYYWAHRNYIIKYKKTPHVIELRKKREHWANYSSKKIAILKKRNKAYQLANLDKFRIGNKKWYRKNREYCLEYEKQRKIEKDYLGIVTVA